jgi:outer membrane protein
MKGQIVLFLTLTLGLVPSASAQTPAASAPASQTKIAVIAFQAAVSQTNEFQRNFADLQKKYEPKRQQLKSLSEEIDSQTKQLQAQGDKLNDAEQASRAKNIEDKKKQAQRIAEDAQNDFQQEMQELFNKVASKVADVLTSYTKQQGYTLVVDVTQQQEQAPAVLYWSPSTDITKTIIEAYNLKSGVPAPPTEPAAAGPKPAAKPPVAH